MSNDVRPIIKNEGCAPPNCENCNACTWLSSGGGVEILLTPKQHTYLCLTCARNLKAMLNQQIIFVESERHGANPLPATGKTPLY